MLQQGLQQVQVLHSSKVQSCTLCDCSSWPAEVVACMQNMHKWIGGPSDEWAFLSLDGPRGPITKAVLAFFLTAGPECTCRHFCETEVDEDS